jgi:hypothetical protein
VRFPGSPPQQLTIAALGHAISTVDLYAESGSDVALGALALEPLHTLEVVVTDATTGSTIEGARVRASEDVPERSRRLGWPAGTTDRKGRARVTSYAESGSYVCVDADGFAPQCIGFGDVGWDSRDGRCEVRLAAGSRVRVHVDDREGAPVPGVSVAATSDLAHSRAVSDAEGIAVFEHLPSGVTQFGCVQLRKRSPEASTEANVGWEGELDVWITSPGVGDLVGRVLDGARTVVGAELTLRVLDASEWKRGRRVDGGIVGSTRSDATGAYRFENVELGPVSIDVSLDRSLAPIGFEVVVEAPQTRFDVDLAGARLRGRVLDSRGRGQPDAIVWFAPVDYRTPLDRGFVDSLPAARPPRDNEGRRTPCFTTDSYGGFDVWMPRDASEFVVSASHARGGAGWTRVARGSDAAPDVEVRLAPAGELELEFEGTRSSGLVVLLPEAEPSAWLVRDVRFDETTRWDALAAGEWRAWRVSAWLYEDGEVGSAASREPTLFKIEPGHRTQVSVPLK